MSKDISIYFTFALSILIGFDVGRFLSNKILWSNNNIENENVIIKYENIDFLFDEKPTIENVRQCIEYYDLLYPETCLSQSVLETGYYQSKICKEYNNLFGLYNSKNKDYYKFEHWSESVLAYKNLVQYKYDGKQDYYEFLIQLPYATDTTYISKLKSIMNRLKQMDNEKSNKHIEG